MMNSNYPTSLNKKLKGFTLIELMISISILSLLLFTGTYSYSMLASRWDKELGNFNEIASQAKSLALIQNALDGVMPYVVISESKKPVFFFIGKQDSLLAVTRKGIFSGNFPEIFRLSALENTNGTFDLVYQALNTQHILLKTTEQTINFSHQITLFENLTSVELSYFGYKHLFDKATFESDKRPIWQVEYSGIDQSLIPEKFELKLDDSGNSLRVFSFLDTKVEFLLTPYSKENL